MTTIYNKKEQFVYGVVHGTGYVSNSEVHLFYKQKDAYDYFKQLKEDCLMHYIRMCGWSEDILELPKDKLYADYGICIDNEYDITWDDIETYERIYVVKLNIR